MFKQISSKCLKKAVYYNKYTYENDRLKTVRHNTDDNEANDVVYTFDYDELGRKTTVKVGNQVLSTNVYSDDRNGILKEVHYGTDENTELPEGISHNNGIDECWQYAMEHSDAQLKTAARPAKSSK